MASSQLESKTQTKQEQIKLDQNRNVQGSVENIFDTLKWLNINPDESPMNPDPKYQPYVQSERLTLYKNIQKMLLKNNLAYPCFCNHERKTQSNSETKKKRKQKGIDNNQNQQENDDGLSPASGYDGTCSRLTLQQVKEKILKGEPYAVRIRGNLFQVPPVFVDQNYGTVPFVKFDDFIIIKKDGWPTFHFANVIDDWKMQISHVIRGEQWLTNTSKHIYLYKVLGATIPKYLHLPLIQNQQGKKLAKRDPTSSLVTLRKQYEPQAIKNFIFRLGWNPKQNVNEKQQIDILSQEQMIECFSSEGITKNPAKFDIKILNHLNKKALKKQWKTFEALSKKQNLSKQETHQLKSLRQSFINKINENMPQSLGWSSQRLILIWQILHDRITVNSDIQQNDFFFKKGLLSYSGEKSLKDLKTLFGPDAQIKQERIVNVQHQKLIKNRQILHNLRLILEHIVPENQFLEDKIAKKISEYLFENRSIKNEEFYHLLRFMITEQKSGPNILKVMIILGRQRCLQILSNFHNLMKTSEESK